MVSSSLCGDGRSGVAMMDSSLAETEEDEETGM